MGEVIAIAFANLVFLIFALGSFEGGSDGIGIFFLILLFFVDGMLLWNLFSPQSFTSVSKPAKPDPKYVPKCPTCGSADIEDISTLSRMTSLAFKGLASDKLGKTKRCKNCGYKW